MTTIRLKVHTEANRERVARIGEDSYEVWIKEVAQKGRANERLREIVADIANVSPKTVKMLKGGKSRFKTFVINSDGI